MTDYASDTVGIQTCVCLCPLPVPFLHKLTTIFRVLLSLSLFLSLALLRTTIKTHRYEGQQNYVTYLMYQQSLTSSAHHRSTEKETRVFNM